MAAITTRLRFTNAVYIAPTRPLLEVAKQVATAAVIAEGRVALTVGAGWMREEFELLGQSFHDRGRRLDEMIPGLRALCRGGWVSWSGEHHEVPEPMLEPHHRHPCRSCAAASRTPLFDVPPGCVTAGWAPHTRWDDAVSYVNGLNALRREYGRWDEPFEIMLP